MFRLYDDDLNPETNSQPLEAPTSPTSPQKPTETKFSAMKRSKEPKTRLQMFKLLLSAGGLLNCGGMLVMSGYIFLRVDNTDFFSVCYSISQAMLFFVAGILVGVAEGRFIFPDSGGSAGGGAKTLRNTLGRFFMNKLGLALFYFWIGALIMGGKNYTVEGQRTLGRVIGILSWVLSISNVATSCAFDRAGKEGQAADRTGAAEKSLGTANANIGKPLDVGNAI